MEIIKILRIVFLFIAIWWTIVNFAKITLKNGIPPWNFIVQAIGIVGTIVTCFDEYFL